ncbi:hypothetical protein R3W88_019748 [Solanum pinnatisectum]|uniref:Uncharacterized protein n=1 Tax=Solanum pinnatisectum TaxID=50273 RepID=A0AAV9KKT6_9SOLN|nr:hypothetical protein R3W88_019748 [Solanum pinnatisectum]
MIFSNRFDLISFFLNIQNNGAFDQDLLPFPIWALARIETFMPMILSTEVSSFIEPKQKLSIDLNLKSTQTNVGSLTSI